MADQSYSDVQKLFPEAWEALPEAYKADSCLQFYTDDEGVIWCVPRLEEIPNLGNWECFWNGGSWVMCR